jgi:hypothetical protein
MSLTKQDLNYSETESSNDIASYPVGFHRGLVEWDLERTVRDYWEEFGSEPTRQKLQALIAEIG